MIRTKLADQLDPKELDGQKRLQIYFFLVRIISILTYTTYGRPKSLCGSILAYTTIPEMQQNEEEEERAYLDVVSNGEQ